MPRPTGPAPEQVMPGSQQGRKPAATGGRRLTQWALDFFAPALPAQATGLEGSPRSPQDKLLSQADTVPSAAKKAAGQAVPQPDSFIHPRATRQIVLDGRLVAYAVKRGKRRTIGFCVGSEGLAVSAPQGLALPEIDQAVCAKSGWILKKLTDMRERQQQLDTARTDWKEGARFAFLGKPVHVFLEPAPDRRRGQAVLDADIGSANAVRRLRITLPADASPEEIQQATEAWLMQQARQVFSARLDFFAPQLGVQWRTLGLSKALTRWGSASSSGTIRLNWRLVHFSQEVVDYVVVHELSHLRFMDHSPRFWATVESVLPDHRALRQQLKKAMF